MNDIYANTHMPMCLNAAESDLSFTLLIALLILGARTETSIPVMQSGVSEARLRQVVAIAAPGDTELLVDLQLKRSSMATSKDGYA